VIAFKHLLIEMVAYSKPQQRTPFVSVETAYKRLRAKGLLAVENLYKDSKFCGTSIDGLLEKRINRAKELKVVCNADKHGRPLHTCDLVNAKDTIQLTPDKILKYLYKDTPLGCKADYRFPNHTVLLEFGNLIVVDCDVKNGIDGIKVFEDRCARHGVKLNTYYVNTPSGGRHYYFRIPDGVVIKRDNYDKFYTEVDIKMSYISSPYNSRIKDGEQTGPFCYPERDLYMPADEDAPIEDMPDFLHHDVLKHQYERAMRRSNNNRRQWNGTSDKFKDVVSVAEDTVSAIVERLDVSRCYETKSWWSVMYHLCVLLGDGARELCHRFSQPWPRYDEKQIDSRVDRFQASASASKQTSLTMLLRKLRQDIGEDEYAEFAKVYLSSDPLEIKVAEMVASTDPSLDIIADKHIHEQYVDASEFFDKGHRLTVIRSCLGTGKSYSARLICKKNRGAKILIISARISLDRNIAQNLNADLPPAEQFVLYSDAINSDGRIVGNRIVCQVDSCWKIDVSDYDILIIDEPRGTMSHVMNMANKRAFEAVKQRIQSTPRVLVTDAFIDDSTISTLENMVGTKAYVVDNEYRRYTHETAYISVIDTTDVYYLRVLALVGDKVKLACPCSSIEVASNLHKDIISKFPDTRVLLMTAETHDTKHIHPDEWVNYDVIIYSPTIVYGVSFDVEDHFEIVCAYFDNNTISSVDCVQMLKRVRNSEHTEVYYKHTNPRHALITSEKQFDAYVDEIDKNDTELRDNLHHNYDYVKQRPIVDEYYTALRHERVQRDRDSSMMPQRIGGLLEMIGMEVQFIVPETYGMTAKEKKERRAKLHEELDAEYNHTENVIERKCEVVEDIKEQPVPTKDVFDRLIAMEPSSLSDAERAQIKHGRYNYAYDATIEDDNVSDAPQIKATYDLLKEKNMDIAKRQRDIVYASENGLEPAQIRDLYNKEFVKAVEDKEQIVDGTQEYIAKMDEAKRLKLAGIAYDIAHELEVELDEVPNGYTMDVNDDTFKDVIMPALEKHHKQVSTYKKTVYDPRKARAVINKLDSIRQWSEDDKKLVKLAKQYVRNITSYRSEPRDTYIERYRLVENDGQYKSLLVDEYDKDVDVNRKWGHVKHSMIEFLNAVWSNIGMTITKQKGEYRLCLVNDGHYKCLGITICSRNSTLEHIANQYLREFRVEDGVLYQRQT
jgi:Bifunctional DNA primase/polymerase, N-terminal/Origin of replication binding protein